MNFDALLKRLRRICRIFVISAFIVDISVLYSTATLLLFFSTNGFIVASISSITFFRSNSSMYSSIFPDSTFERSRMSLINPNKCLPELFILSRSGIKSSFSSSASSISISLYPIMAFSGVLSS